ncbi:MAG: GMC family oxidoreductase [Paracoccaceae bacterium]|nr:GMC family oxidoreductase [Paracoccaceae bacterium]
MVRKRIRAILEFDLVIVGAGSAGSIVAGRLAERTDLRILVLEAGGSDFRPDIKVPIGYGMSFFNPDVNWCYSSLPQKALNSRTLYVPRGKVIGGSASINAMVYLRGLKNDFDDWESFSSSNFGWDSVTSTYNEIEGIRKNSKKKRMHVSDVSSQHQAMIKNFIKASAGIGFNYTLDLNSDISEGVGHYPLSTKNGVRWTSADGFLRPALKMPNLTIFKNSQVTKLNIINGKVTEVDFIKGNQVLNKVKARVGVILTAGAINTPQLLMLSGIGPKKVLTDVGIDVVTEDKNIGQNLQDHLGIDYLYETNSVSLNKILGRWKGRLSSMLKYLFNRAGPFSLSVNQGGGFVNWKSKTESANIQLYFNPLTYSIKHNPKKRELLKPDAFDGFAIGFQPCRPMSRGEVTLASSEPLRPPLINMNFLNDETDLYDVKCGIECMEALLNNEELSSITVKEKSVNLGKQSLEEKLEDFRNRSVSIYHLCGTCRLGSDASKAPVSNDFKLRALSNVWIGDASLFPNVTSGNINAPVMMLASKAADSICHQLSK